MNRDQVDSGGKGIPPARESVHISEQEVLLIETIRNGNDPATLMELAVREIISRLPPEQSEQQYPADLEGAGEIKK